MAFGGGGGGGGGEGGGAFFAINLQPIKGIHSTITESSPHV